MLVHLPLFILALSRSAVASASASPGSALFSSAFDGLSGSDLAKWLQNLSNGCRDSNIPGPQCADTAISLLQGDMQLKAQEERKRVLENAGEWEWESFEKFITRAYEQSNKSLLERHPYMLATVAGVGAAAGSFVLIPVVGIAALGAVGFTSGGVLAGSAAAAAQSFAYGGLTSGIFATLQSAAASGVVASTPFLAAGASAVGVGVGKIVNQVLNSDRDPDAGATDTDQSDCDCSTALHSQNTRLPIFQ